MKTTRRGFLKVAGGAIAAFLVPVKIAAETHNPKPTKYEHLSLRPVPGFSGQLVRCDPNKKALFFGDPVTLEDCKIIKNREGFIAKFK